MKQALQVRHARGGRKFHREGIDRAIKERKGPVSPIKALLAWQTPTLGGPHGPSRNVGDGARDSGNPRP